MARAVSARQDQALAQLMYCPFCGARRQGESLIKHCFDKHNGQIALNIKLAKPADLLKLKTLLARNDIELVCPPDDTTTIQNAVRRKLLIRGASGAILALAFAGLARVSHHRHIRTR
jgi:hypothetical protein